MRYGLCAGGVSKTTSSSPPCSLRRLAFLLFFLKFEKSCETIRNSAVKEEEGGFEYEIVFGLVNLDWNCCPFSFIKE